MEVGMRQFQNTSRSLLIVVLWLIMANVLLAAEPPAVARWDFGAEETTRLRSHGGVHRDVPGPRPPEYPDFDSNNTAVQLDGSGAHLSFEDTGAQSEFDFQNGDTISLETWLQVDDLNEGEFQYVIGKGRTGAKGFPPDNQNWALRVRGKNGKACVSFLFATPLQSGSSKGDSHWHRWTTASGFAPGKSWHHIAVTYSFGKPDSIRGWIDGQPQPGSWDMGGATEESPVVDDDAVWIGSSRGGAPGNSFRGSLDAIAIHRRAFDDELMKSRFRREGSEKLAMPAPESMPDVGDIPPGRVVITFHEGMPSHTRWLNDDETLPAETLRWTSSHFLLDRLPQRFDDWGIREAWKAPVLIQTASRLSLTPGKYRFLIRVRGLSRLWVNGTVIARSQPLTGSPSGEEPVTPVSPPPLPGLRSAEHRQQEIFGDALIGADGLCHVVLETIVGGKSLRTDPGETCVAIQVADDGPFLLVGSGEIGTNPVLLTDEDVGISLSKLESSLQAFDDERRRAAAATQDDYWAGRHQVAKQWAEQHPAPAVPNTAEHPIDTFITAKVARALAESSKTSAKDAQQFHNEVQPILREQCFRCHGDKSQGGLQLNSREAALRGGDSALSAVVPGQSAGSELIRRVTSSDPDERMPPGSSGLGKEQIAVLESWIQAGAKWPAPPLTPEDVAYPQIVTDAAFLRRVFLDSVGVPPSEDEFSEFMKDQSPQKRERAIDRLLADERGVDHWMSYWLDVLAENPTLINASLNTTGPFRWFLYDAFRDRKSFDRIVTELILMRGSPHEGGSAGFSIAADNDAPFAAKGQIIASAFLGIDLQCARCHDSPYHSTKQRDLYALAAMFEQKPVTVPKTSRVPGAFFENKVRESLIRVTLKHDEPIDPVWPFVEVTGSPDHESLTALLQHPENSRELLAALITAPHNTRFAQVVVNRVWRRLMGAGLVEPVHDWEGHAPSHPEILQWLAHEFIQHDYDLQHIVRLILTSQTYQREAVGNNLVASPDLRFFVAPERRRMSAEQVVDSLYSAAGQEMDVEELTFDPDARRPASNRLTLGRPRRAWMLASLANERDRPSLGLPRARAITDIMEAFGWTGSRQNPRTDRENASNVLQPGVMSNSTAITWLTRAARDSGLAEIAVSAATPESLVDRIFVRYLCRLPNAEERLVLARQLAEGFEDRVLPTDAVSPPTPLEPLPRVTWSNHLRPETTTIAIELERRARLGPPVDPRLRPEWREAYEDVVWGVINLREFVWVP